MYIYKIYDVNFSVCVNVKNMMCFLWASSSEELGVGHRLGLVQQIMVGGEE